MSLKFALLVVLAASLQVQSSPTPQWLKNPISGLTNKIKEQMPESVKKVVEVPSNIVNQIPLPEMVTKPIDNVKENIQNIVEEVQEKVEDLQKQVEERAAEATEKISEVLPIAQIKEQIETIQEKVQEVVAPVVEIVEQVQDKVEEAQKQVEEKINEIEQKVDEASEKIEEVIPVVEEKAEIVKEVAEETQAEAPAVEVSHEEESSEVDVAKESKAPKKSFFSMFRPSTWFNWFSNLFKPEELDTEVEHNEAILR